MHITQRDVIAKLMYADELRYSEIKPKDMSGNQFAYHLDKLIRRKLVEKTGDGFYSLTADGMARTDRLSYKSMKKTVQPKLNVTLFVRNSKGEILMWRRGRQPYTGFWNLPATRIRNGETPNQALHRQTKDRADLPEMDFEFERVVSLRYEQAQEVVVADLVQLIYSSPNPIDDDYILPNERFKFFSMNELKDTDVFPGIADTIKKCLEDSPEALSELEISV